LTRIWTCPGPGAGISISSMRRTSGPPNSWKRIMRAISHQLQNNRT